MKLKICKKFPLFIFANLLLPYSCFATSYPSSIYPGNPEISKLTPEVAADKMFANAPKRTVKQTNLISHAASTGQYRSHYQMNPVYSQGFKTKYWTREIIQDGLIFNGIAPGSTAIVDGKGISYGGIFWPLEKMTVTGPNGYQLYYNKIDITNIKHKSGHLFPLKVGNDLQFYFTRLHERDFNGKHTFVTEHGVMEYQVIKQFQNFPTAENKIPGKIFSILVYESTDRHPQKYLTDEYAYSDALGWYIGDKYFDKANQLLAVYRVHKWK